MEEEKELKKNLFYLQNKHKNISITYNNVIENINQLLQEEGYVETEGGEKRGEEGRDA